jgi:glycosyltransferase involved in cell wall biosynthesis
MTIVGDGPEAGMIESLAAADATLRGRVRLTGQLPKQAIAREMNQASLLMFPSAHETFGIVVAEAMACGLPVIIGDRAAPIEFVDDSSGISVPADDVGQLAAALRDMVGNLDRYDSAAIRRTVVERFGFEAFGARLRAVYESL